MDIPYKTSDGGFISLATSIEKARSTEKAHELDGMPMSLFNASILNEKGEIRVADSIYVVKKGVVQVLSIHDTLKMGKNIAYKSYEIIKKTASEKGCSAETSYNGSTYRILGRAFINFYSYYTEAGASTSWEKRKKILWWYNWDSSFDGIEDIQYPNYTSVERLSIVYNNTFSSPYNEYTRTGISHSGQVIPGYGPASYSYPTHSRTFISSISGHRISGQMLLTHRVTLTNGQSVSCSNSIAEWWY